jgi:hypothetical protein
MAAENPSLQAEAEEAFFYILAPTVQTVLLDNGYGYGVSIELGRFTAAALQLDDRVRASLASPKRGCRILNVLSIGQ